MKIYSSVPVYKLNQPNRVSDRRRKKRVVIKTEFLNASGDEFIPFDGLDIEQMTGFLTEDGDTFYSADGEEFYNAKGEKVKGEGLKNFLKKIGKGIGKGFMAVGKGVKGLVQAVGRKIKERKVRRQERREDKIADTQEGGSGTKPKRGARKVAMVEERNADGTTMTKAIEPLPTGSPDLKPEEKVVVANVTYDARALGKGASVTVATDESGNKIVGAEVPLTNVVGIKGADGKYDYYPAAGTDSGNKGKINMTYVWIGLAVVGVGAAIYFIKNKK